MTPANVSAGVDGTVRVWDLATGKVVSTLVAVPGRDWTAGAVIPFADGMRLATGHGDGTIVVWDLVTGQRRTTIRTHDGVVSSLALAADGRTLASGSDQGGTVRLWDPDTGRERGVLPGHGCGVESIAWSDGGSTIAVGGEDELVRQWRPAPAPVD